MRILFPIRSIYPSQIGGPTNTVYWLTTALTKKKINITIVSSSRGIKDNTIIKNEFITTSFGKVYYGSGGTLNLKTIFKALMEVKNNDIIHLNSLFDIIAIPVFFFTKLFYPSKSIVFSVRGVLSEAALSFGNIRKSILLFFYKTFNNNVYYHATSQIEIQQIKKRLKIKDNIFCLPNYINPAKRLNHIEIEKNILFLGRIHPIKCVENLIRAISLSKSFIQNNFKLQIVGTYREREISYYRKILDIIKELKLEDCIEFKGHIEGKEKEKIIAQSYILILPSESENFGNVVLEALNQGTPVIASKNTPWEILPDSSAGFHVENDSQSLAKAIDKSIMLEKNQYLNYRKNATKLVDDAYNIHANIDKWIKKYNDIST